MMNKTTRNQCGATEATDMQNATTSCIPHVARLTVFVSHTQNFHYLRNYVCSLHCHICNYISQAKKKNFGKLFMLTPNFKISNPPTFVLLFIITF